jgi:hypothetical protein
LVVVIVKAKRDSNRTWLKNKMKGKTKLKGIIINLKIIEIQLNKLKTLVPNT